MAFDAFVGNRGERRVHGGICLHFVCDFNGGWLKDLSFFSCFYSINKCGRLVSWRLYK
jgi:hypothetical protein